MAYTAIPATTSTGSCPYTLIQTQTVAVDAASVTFGSLSGDTDGAYFWIIDGIAGTGAVIGDSVVLRPNGLSTNLHSFTQWAQGFTGTTNNVTGSGAGSSAVVCLGVVAGMPWSCVGYFYPKTGKIRTFTCDFYQADSTDANNRGGYSRGTWTDTSTAVTSLQFISGHNTFGAGTRASLYKI